MRNLENVTYPVGKVFSGSEILYVIRQKDGSYTVGTGREIERIMEHFEDKAEALAVYPKTNALARPVLSKALERLCEGKDVNFATLLSGK